VKVSLIYNLDAGGGLDPDRLQHEIESAGHEVVARLPSKDDPLDKLPEDTEVVAVAGGDGTVGRLAMQLAGRGLPLAVLPFGTANNIATSLGILGSTHELVRAWNAERRLRLDVGVAGGVWGERRFVESTGAGFVPSGIHTMDSEEHPESDEPRAMLHKALRRFRDVLRALVPRPTHLVLDGEASDEELLMVQVLNLRAVGPGLVLAPDGDPSDGAFDVVTATEAERPLLERYLHDRIEGRPAAVRLPVRRARRVELTGWRLFHVDDEIERDLVSEAVTVSMARDGIEVLAGPLVHA
jgi:diacylglycerol kinase family enzyme